MPGEFWPISRVSAQARLRLHRSVKHAPPIRLSLADLIPNALPFGRLWYLEVSDAIDYAKFRSRAHDAVIRVYYAAGNVIETHEHSGEFKEP